MPLFGPPSVDKLKRKRDTDGLVKALKHKDVFVRRAAAEALGTLRDPQGVEPLIAALRDGDIAVREAAATSLGRIRDGRAIQPLARLLNDEHAGGERLLDNAEIAKFVSICEAAAESLGKLGHGDAHAIEALTAALQAAHSRVRRAAAEALGTLRDPRAAEPLVARLRDEHSEVRDAVWGALLKLGSAAVEPLINALKSDDSWVRMRVVLLLGDLADERAVEPLESVLTSDQDASVRGDAARILGQLRDSRAVEPLTAALHDTDGQVRREAVEALGDLADSRATEGLVAALEDEDVDVSFGAAESLAILGDPRGAETLISRLGVSTSVDQRIRAKGATHRRDHPMRHRAKKALLELGESAVEPLIRKLRDTPERVGAGGTAEEVFGLGGRRADFVHALDVLQMIGGPEAERVLKEYAASQ